MNTSSIVCAQLPQGVFDRTRPLLSSKWLASYADALWARHAFLPHGEMRHEPKERLRRIGGYNVVSHQFQPRPQGCPRGGHDEQPWYRLIYRVFPLGDWQNSINISDWPHCFSREFSID